MKQRKIYMKTWLEAHRRVKVVATDQWYLDFVNELLPLVAESSLYWETAEEDQQQVAFNTSFVFGRLCGLTGKLETIYPLASEKLRTLPSFLFVDGRISA